RSVKRHDLNIRIRRIDWIRITHVWLQRQPNVAERGAPRQRDALPLASDELDVLQSSVQRQSGLLDPASCGQQRLFYSRRISAEAAGSIHRIARRKWHRPIRRML